MMERSVIAGLVSRCVVKSRLSRCLDLGGEVMLRSLSKVCQIMVICCILHNLVFTTSLQELHCANDILHTFLLAICRIPCELGSKTMHVHFLSVYLESH